MPGVKRPAPGSDAPVAIPEAQATDTAAAAAAAEYWLVHDINISKVRLSPDVGSAAATAATAAAVAASTTADTAEDGQAGEKGWICPPPITTFTGAPFDSRLGRELRTTQGFTAPAPVQAACWP